MSHLAYREDRTDQMPQQFRQARDSLFSAALVQRKSVRLFVRMANAEAGFKLRIASNGPYHLDIEDCFLEIGVETATMH